VITRFINSRWTERYQGRTRRGTILICVLACLVITSAMIAGTIQTVLRDRREVRLERQLRQTELLCEAGVLRASQKLKMSDDYHGETWAPKLNSELWDTASVEIRVTVADDSSDQRVEVVAKLGSASTELQPMQRSRNFTFQTSAPSSSEKS
jgi:type II secretory pathway component PulK